MYTQKPHFGWYRTSWKNLSSYLDNIGIKKEVGKGNVILRYGIIVLVFRITVKVKMI